MDAQIAKITISSAKRRVSKHQKVTAKFRCSSVVQLLSNLHSPVSFITLAV